MGEPVVKTEQGKVLGKVSTDFQGNAFFSFQGIPYAKPPVGDLRFKPPQPAEAWSETLDATKEGAPCLSRNVFSPLKEVSGAEDCLFLNVYTPSLRNEDPTLKPVMFFIHGGGFTTGSSTTDLYGPEFLIPQDVVLVTMNYRVGILGFFQIKDSSLGVTGNAGLKDQVLALKWVQQNIRNFGGDPDNVTIFGESAGGTSVHYLMLSPLAKNLFHKAIAQSGLAINVFSKSRYVVPEIAEILQISADNEKDILDHLSNLSADELQELQEKITDAAGPNTLRHFAPVVEPNVPGAFITEEPIKILNSGEYNQVPLMLGYTSREGMLFEVLARPLGPATLPDNFEGLVPLNLGLKPGSEELKIVARKIKNFYCGNGKGDDIDTFYLVHGDNYFIRDIVFGARRHAETLKFPVYLYRVSVESKLNMLKILLSVNNPGVCHGDDLGYLFKTSFLPPVQEGTLEHISLQRFTTLWANFAKNGNPNPKDGPDDVIGVEWKPVKKSEVNYLDIGEDLVAGVNPDAARMTFWEEIFRVNPLYRIRSEQKSEAATPDFGSLKSFWTTKQKP